MSLSQKLHKVIQSLSNKDFCRALRFGVSPSHEHRGMLESLGQLMTIVDVGANVGQFALLSLRYQPKAHIHSFEPLEAAAATFTKVIDGNPRVTLHRFALGAESRTLPMHVTLRADSSSLLEPALQATVFPGTHEVSRADVDVAPLTQVLTIDEIKGPALLKIDVQGFEAEVLRGCEGYLDAFDWIFVELSFVELYAGQKLAPLIIEYLNIKGFEICSIYSDPHSYLNGRMVQGDFLFKKIEN